MSIFELSQLTNIQELKTCPAMGELLKIVSSDLRTIEDYLGLGIDHTTKINDPVTQSKLIDFQDTV